MTDHEVAVDIRVADVSAEDIMEDQKAASPGALQSGEDQAGMPQALAPVHHAKGKLDTLGSGLATKLKVKEVRAKRRRRVFTRALRSEELSHEETRPDFLNLDYTPGVIQRPIDMAFPLRVRRQKKDIELFFCVTVHAQSGTELRDTLRGIGENIRDLQIKLGLEWDEMAVAVVVDGRSAADSSLLEFCQDELHLYDPGMLQLIFHGAEVVLHLFEKSVELPKFKEQREYHEPMQMILAIKEKPMGRVNSHLWFFTAFCRQIQPTYTILIDAGVVPEAKSIFRMLNYMENNENAGAVAGEIRIRDLKLYNLWSGTQHVQNKLEHIFEKCRFTHAGTCWSSLMIQPAILEWRTICLCVCLYVRMIMITGAALESVCGFVMEAPSSFAAYRWVAIRGQPLNHYFYVEENSIADMGPYHANAFLAEDRMLAMELVTKTQRRWRTSYVPNAVAYAPYPDSLVDMLKTDRRRLNGAFFALLYFFAHCPRHSFRTSHSACRLLTIGLLYFYKAFTFLFEWIAVGTMFLLTHFVADQALSHLPIGKGLSYTFTMVYAGLVIAQVLVGLGSKPEQTALIYRTTAILYGILALGFGVFFAVLFAVGDLPVLLLIIIGGIVGAYVLLILLHGQLFQTIKALPHYFFALPSLVNLVPVFCYCNTNDISREGNERLAFQLNKGNQAPVDAAKAADGRARELKKRQEQAEHGNGRRSLNGVKRRKKGKGGKKKSVPRDILLVLHHARRGEDVEAHRGIVEMLAAENSRAKKEEREVARSVRSIQRSFAAFRTRFISFWLAINWLYVTLFIYFGFREYFTYLVLGIVAFYTGFRITGSFMFLLFRWTGLFSRCLKRTLCRCCYKEELEEMDQPAIAKRRSSVQSAEELPQMQFVEEFDEDGNLIARYPKQPLRPPPKEKKGCCGRKKKDNQPQVTWARHASEGWHGQDTTTAEVARRRSSITKPPPDTTRPRNMRKSMSGTDLRWLDHLRAEEAEAHHSDEEEDDGVVSAVRRPFQASTPPPPPDYRTSPPPDADYSMPAPHQPFRLSDLSDDDDEDDESDNESTMQIAVDDYKPAAGELRGPEPVSQGRSVRSVRISGIEMNVPRRTSNERPGRTLSAEEAKVGSPPDEPGFDTETDAVARVLAGMQREAFVWMPWKL